MKNLKILNKKQLKNINHLLKKQFNTEFNFSPYAVLVSQKNKIYIANKEIFSIELGRIKVNSIGMYFAAVKNNELRLSIEGSQLIGKKAKKNIVELSDNEFKQWIQGIDIDKIIPPNLNNQFVIIKHNNDFIGCGKVKDNKILNYVPKTRRIRI